MTVRLAFSLKWLWPEWKCRYSQECCACSTTDIKQITFWDK